MGIDIFSIQPSTVSRNLKGKFVCIYGAPKLSWAFIEKSISKLRN